MAPAHNSKGAAMPLVKFVRGVNAAGQSRDKGEIAEISRDEMSLLSRGFDYVLAGVDEAPVVDVDEDAPEDDYDVDFDEDDED